MRTHDTAARIPENDDELMHPERYWDVLERLKKALPPQALKQLEAESVNWMQNPRYEMAHWLRQRRQAEHEVEVHSSRFVCEAPLAYNMYFPPPAPWPPGDSLNAVLNLIPGHLRDMDGVDVLIAEGLRLNALNQFLINEQHELVTPKWDYNFLVHQASSDGLGVTYGVDTEPDIDENTQHEPNAKKRNDQWKKQQGRRNRTNAPDTPLDAGDIIYVAAMTPISLARMEALLLTLAAEREREEARAREAERNSSYAAAGIGRPFRPN